MNSDRAWTARELRSELNRYESQLRASGKARNTVATYVQHPERFINWLEGRYHPGAATFERADSGPRLRGRTSAYHPLHIHLLTRTEDVVHMTFGEIERILGKALPPSARRYRPWWANEMEGTHSHARSWLDAGRKTQNVDLNAGTVEFRRSNLLDPVDD
jgi:hypothetical protein